MYKTVYWIEANSKMLKFWYKLTINSIERCAILWIHFIYIKPEISQYGVISFDKGKEIIRKGEETFAVYEQ
jgi:hypothetical protein